MNNRANLVFNIVISIAVIILAILQINQVRSSKGNSTANTKPLDVKNINKNKASSPLVYVNTDSLLLGYEFYKKVRKELDTKLGGIEGDIKGRGQQLEGEIQSFQKTANTMSVQTAKTTEQSLMLKQQEFEQYREKIGREFAEEERKTNEKLSENITTFMKKYGQANGHLFVLGFSKGGGILYADSTLDVTKEVLKGLNEEYKAKSSK